jgi:hypothetical protein
LLFRGIWQSVTLWTSLLFQLADNELYFNFIDRGLVPMSIIRKTHNLFSAFRYTGHEHFDAIGPSPIVGYINIIVPAYFADP